MEEDPATLKYLGLLLLLPFVLFLTSHIFQRFPLLQPQFPKTNPPTSILRNSIVPPEMSLKNDKFPASQAFDDINSAITASEAEKKDAIKKGQAVFAFTLKNKAGETDSWHIDLKEKGEVAKGLGEKPTVTLSLSDEDFGKLVTGKANAQRLFMSGKLKVKGDVMKATKLEPLLAKARPVAAKL